MKITGHQYVSLSMVLMFLVFYPVLSVDQPPLADYRNNLARIHVWISYGSNNAVPHVEPVLTLQPNMAFDVVTEFLALFMPLEQAGRGLIF